MRSRLAKLRRDPSWRWIVALIWSGINIACGATVPLLSPRMALRDWATDQLTPTQPRRS